MFPIVLVHRAFCSQVGAISEHMIEQSSHESRIAGQCKNRTTQECVASKCNCTNASTDTRLIFRWQAKRSSRLGASWCCPFKNGHQLNSDKIANAANIAPEPERCLCAFPLLSCAAGAIKCIPRLMRTIAVRFFSGLDDFSAEFCS